MGDYDHQFVVAKSTSVVFIVVACCVDCFCVLIVVYLVPSMDREEQARGQGYGHRRQCKRTTTPPLPPLPPLPIDQGQLFALVINMLNMIQQQQQQNQ